MTEERTIEGRIRDGENQGFDTSRWLRVLSSREYAQGGAFRLSVDKRSEPAWSHLARETFANLYGFGASRMPEDERPQGSEWVNALHDQIAQLPEWQALRERAARDAWAAGVAAGQALAEIAPHVQPPASDAQDAREAIERAEREGAGPDALTALREALDAAVEEDDQAAQSVANGAAQIRRALRAAAVKAQGEIEEVNAAVAALGAGTETGQAARTPAPREQVRAAIASLPKLRRIAALAGRLRAQAISKQSQRAQHGAEEVCDVKPGADIARLLPSEAMMLASPDTEALLIARLAERKAMTYELRGRENRARGPIVMLIDGSSSMTGRPEEWSKAVALALAEIAARQGRQFAVVHYAGEVSRVDVFENPRAMALPALLDTLAHFPGGGTVLSKAVAKAGEIMKRGAWTRADLVIVSDGVDSSVDAATAEIAALRKAVGCVAYGIAIGCEFPPALAKACEDVAQITSADLAGATSKVDRVFSI